MQKIHNLSNTTEIVENKRPIKLSPLLWKRFVCDCFKHKFDLTNY